MSTVSPVRILRSIASELVGKHRFERWWLTYGSLGQPSVSVRSGLSRSSERDQLSSGFWRWDEDRLVRRDSEYDKNDFQCFLTSGRVLHRCRRSIRRWNAGTFPAAQLEGLDRKAFRILLANRDFHGGESVRSNLATGSLDRLSERDSNEENDLMRLNIRSRHQSHRPIHLQHHSWLAFDFVHSR